MNFGNLKTYVESILGRSPEDVVYELVTADINSMLRLSIMESTTTLVEASTVTLPTDFRAVVDIYRDTDPRYPLRPVPPQSINRQYVTSGIPSQYAIVDGEMILNPSPSGSENIQLRYIAALADLVDNTDENDVLTKYPGIYIYGACSHHCVLVRDYEAKAPFDTSYRLAMQTARQEDANLRATGVPVSPVRRGMTP